MTNHGSPSIITTLIGCPVTGKLDRTSTIVLCSSSTGLLLVLPGDGRTAGNNEAEQVRWLVPG
ncbi:hypothetical protein [Kitasatospora sp. NPDC059599]|uniref:hypothetical protein n=1 Tax=Kitasatospora sp. NPDC059599 TaxID=3346880 RepID=UPI0036B4F2D1